MYIHFGICWVFGPKNPSILMLCGIKHVHTFLFVCKFILHRSTRFYSCVISIYTNPHASILGENSFYTDPSVSIRV